ncbi:hypothetical protein DL765_004542 [Monosporascus sp. GIB2]|nr:hypothetical protein DL765_004542 [Monosporascus sp. GIB2]
MTGLNRATHLSLSESYQECIDLFGRFVLTLCEEGCGAISLEQVRFPDILEEYGRTKIWGDQTNAVLPARARGSLDDTLRHDDELKCLVHDILTRLRALLRQATSIARKKFDLVVGSENDSTSSASTDTDFSSDDVGEYRSRRVPKICLLVQQIFEQVRSLYDLSSLLRRPNTADKYIRSTPSKPDTAALGDSDTLPLSVGFSSSDESHVLEKVLQWRSMTKSGRSFEFEDENVAAIGKGLTNDQIEGILWFCQRLARANTRRREQLQYWIDHPCDSKQDATNAAQLETLNLAQIRAQQVEEKQESRSQASTLKPPNLNISREGPKSALSKQSFSTAAVSDSHDTRTDVRPRTVYAPTAIGKGRSNCVPDPPKTENGKITFPCPYCGTMLESSEMQNRQSWKRHVFRDLRPYVCTFKDCQNSGKLYVSRHDWTYHELQIHRREFVCKECRKVCPSRNDMSTHLREHYDGSTPLAQLGVILDLCSRQIDVSENREDQCLMCGEELSLLALYEHLAAHMEDIALFVLPNPHEEEENGCSEASVQVAGLKSKDKTSTIESDTSSLGFSVAGDHGQNSAEFARLLSSEEAGYTLKFSSWRTTEEDRKSAVTTWSLSPSENDARTELVRQQFGYAKKTFEQREEVLGREHPDTLSSMNELAFLLQSQGKHEEAEQMYRRTLELREAALGRKHPDTFTSMNNLAGVLREQGKYEEAKQMHRQILELKEGTEAAVQLVLERGADLELKDKDDQTPLLRAVRNGQEAIVKLLLITEKADPDSKDSEYGRTPLSWAAGNGHEAIVKLLLATGRVDVNSTDSEHVRTPLSWAAENGHEAVVKLLLATGEADIDSNDKYGQTPLLWAAENGHEAVVKLLLATGKVDVESKDSNHGRTPLSWAAAKGHEGVVKLLLDTGKADVNSKDNDHGRTPLLWAAENGHEAVVKLLLATGKVDIDSKDKRS